MGIHHKTAAYQNTYINVHDVFILCNSFNKIGIWERGRRDMFTEFHLCPLQMLQRVLEAGYLFKSERHKS